MGNQRLMKSRLFSWLCLQRKLFEPSGQFSRLFPLYEAVASFLFVFPTITQKAPAVRDYLDLKRIMTIVVLALLPATIFGIYNAGYHSLALQQAHFSAVSVWIRGAWIVFPIIAVSYSVGGFWEILFAVVRRREISEGFLVTGLIFPLILPPSIPLWQVALGMTVGIVIGKEIFGGTGRNFMNPALVGRAFLFFSFPARMSGDAVWTALVQAKSSVTDAVTHATPLAIAKLAEAPLIVERVLSQAGYGFRELFFGLHVGSIGETSFLCILLGAALLLLTGIASYRIVLGGLGGLICTAFVFSFLSTAESAPIFSMAPLTHIMIGGFAFGLIFMATDPVTAPGVPEAQWVYGFLIGLFVVIARCFNSAYTESTMLVILLMNLFAPLFDVISQWFRKKRRIKNAG